MRQEGASEGGAGHLAVQLRDLDVAIGGQLDFRRVFDTRRRNISIEGTAGEE